MKENTQGHGPTANGSSDCKHWWKIESPHGATAIGICKLCGEEKEYETSYGYTEGRFSKIAIQPTDLTSLPFQVMK